jgi:hypothetical protein
MVVGTRRTHREEFIATPCQDYVLAISLPQNHPAIRKIVDRKSSFQIGFGRIFHVLRGSNRPWFAVT